MQDLIKKQREETADAITDHFFRRGAVVGKKDYLYVLDLLQESQTELIKAVIGEQKVKYRNGLLKRFGDIDKLREYQKIKKRESRKRLKDLTK